MRYIAWDRTSYHCRCDKRQLHDAHEVPPRLDNFRARGSASCGCFRDHIQSLDGLLHIAQQ